MTPQRAKELLPVIQAFSEGKAIQCATRTPDGQQTNWIDITCFNPNDDEHAVIYRIKPEPREFWIVADKPAIHADVCFSRHDAESKMSTRNPTFSEIIHVREVL
jgi:hypothetical protein